MMIGGQLGGQIKDIIPFLGDKELSRLQTVDIADALGEIVKRGAPVHAK